MHFGLKNLNRLSQYQFNSWALLINILPQKIQIIISNSLQNITYFYIWRSNFIMIFKSLMSFLWHMLFSACVKWQIFCGKRFISTCEDGFFKNCATFTFGITRRTTCVLWCSEQSRGPLKYNVVSRRDQENTIKVFLLFCFCFCFVFCFRSRGVHAQRV